MVLTNENVMPLTTLLNLGSTDRVQHVACCLELLARDLEWSDYRYPAFPLAPALSRSAFARSRVLRRTLCRGTA